MDLTPSITVNFVGPYLQSIIKAALDPRYSNVRSKRLTAYYMDGQIPYVQAQVSECPYRSPPAQTVRLYFGESCLDMMQ